MKNIPGRGQNIKIMVIRTGFGYGYSQSLTRQIAHIASGAGGGGGIKNSSKIQDSRQMNPKDIKKMVHRQAMIKRRPPSCVYSREYNGIDTQRYKYPLR